MLANNEIHIFSLKYKIKSHVLKIFTYKINYYEKCLPYQGVGVISCLSHYRYSNRYG